MSLRVIDLMKTSVESLHPEEDLDLAAMLMRIERFHHLPVVDDGGAVVGVVSARDILEAAGGDRRGQLRVRAREVMSSPVVTVAPTAPVAEAAELMRSRDVGCLPVIADGALVGVLSRTDLVRALYHLAP